jgi:hypothetical protein
MLPVIPWENFNDLKRDAANELQYYIPTRGFDKTIDDPSFVVSTLS